MQTFFVYADDAEIPCATLYADNIHDAMTVASVTLKLNIADAIEVGYRMWNVITDEADAYTFAAVTRH